MKSFKAYLQEGNPLARNIKNDTQDRHSVLISAERKGLSPKENSKRMKSLKTQFRTAGYGFRNTEGKWNEGEGVGRENSIQVYANAPGTKAGAALRHLTRKLSKQFGQDAFIHRKPDSTGTAIYTNDTSDGHKKGARVSYGDTHYNTDNPYGETQFKKRKPEGQRPKLTFIPKD